MEENKVTTNAGTTTIRVGVHASDLFTKLAAKKGMRKEQYMNMLAEEAERQLKMEEERRISDLKGENKAGEPEEDQEETDAMIMLLEEIENLRGSILLIKDDISELKERVSSKGTTGENDDDRIISEIQSSKKELKRLIYRMIKELCGITDEDIADPDSRISDLTRADDMLRHPEKYGGKQYF